MTLTYRTYSPIFDRWYEDTREFKDLVSARLYLTALYSGNWYIVEARK